MASSDPLGVRLFGYGVPYQVHLSNGDGVVPMATTPTDEARDLALELGATHSLDPIGDADWAAAVRAIVPDGVQYVLDTTGRPDALAAALSVLAPRGALGLVGIAAPGTPPPGEINNLMTLGHRIIGIIEGDSDPGKPEGGTNGKP